MLSAGRPTIRAHCSASGLSEYQVALQRPALTPLFIGQTPAAVVDSLPLIYTLCTEAQGLALARQAIEPSILALDHCLPCPVELSHA